MAALKNLKWATVPIVGLPRNTRVTCTANFQDFDGYYRGRKVDMNKTFKNMTLGEVLDEIARIEKYRADQRVSCVELDIRDLSIPAGARTAACTISRPRRRKPRRK